MQHVIKSIKNAEIEQVSLLKHSPLKSEVLLAGEKELLIDHGSEIYKLRLTNLGKLILTK